MPAAANQALYEQYREMAARETRERRVYFAGRLAQYRYLNTDEAIEGALATFERLVDDTTSDTIRVPAATALERVVAQAPPIDAHVGS
ncbi:hypothetical protein D3C72_2279270 [compost metagenome]